MKPCAEGGAADWTSGGILTSDLVPGHLVDQVQLSETKQRKDLKGKRRRQKTARLCLFQRGTDRQQAAAQWVWHRGATLTQWAGRRGWRGRGRGLCCGSGRWGRGAGSTERRAAEPTAAPSARRRAAGRTGRPAPTRSAWQQGAPLSRHTSTLPIIARQEYCIHWSKTNTNIVGMVRPWSEVFWVCSV